MSSNHDTFKTKEQAEEARWAKVKEQEQLQALRNNLDSKPADNKSNNQSRKDEIEGGFGGQEELEDRYATTLGEH